MNSFESETKTYRHTHKKGYFCLTRRRPKCLLVFIPQHCVEATGIKSGTKKRWIDCHLTIFFYVSSSLDAFEMITKVKSRRMNTFVSCGPVSPVNNFSLRDLLAWLTWVMLVPLFFLLFMYMSHRRRATICFSSDDTHTHTQMLHCLE